MKLAEASITILNQLREVIEQIKDEDFKRPIPVLSNGTIGQHTRHTLEFFICLIDGRNEKEINYDLRNHDKLIESDRKVALAVVQSIQEFLDKQVDDFDLTFKANYQIHGNEDLTIRSSFYRELAYNIEHAIHHMALMKVGVRALEREITLPDHFGVASSTVRYQLNK